VRDETKERELRAAVGDLAGPPDDPRLVSRAADLAERADMEAFVEHVMRTWGRLDILANLAGGFAGGGALDVASMQALWEQNVRTAVTVTAACVTPMRARRYGRIVTVGSISALKARKGAAGYAMAKGALVRWTEALAEELKDEGITANCVLPSIIDHPANRARMPKADPKTWVGTDELARLIVFLASDDSSAVTGAAIPVTART
jgi:NAD(P)-dependent dehydrogenase (short-subunit alcohol dehydrogenase family)